MASPHAIGVLELLEVRNIYKVPLHFVAYLSTGLCGITSMKQRRGCRQMLLELRVDGELYILTSMRICGEPEALSNPFFLSFKNVLIPSTIVVQASLCSSPVYLLDYYFIPTTFSTIS